LNRSSSPLGPTLIVEAHSRRGPEIRAKLSEALVLTWKNVVMSKSYWFMFNVALDF